MTDNLVFQEETADELPAARRRVAELEAALEESRRNTVQAENQRRELAGFLEDAVIGIQTVAPDGVIRWANRAALDMLGYTRDEYLGHPISEFYTDREAAADFLERLRHSAGVVTHESRLRCQDGSFKHVRMDCNAVWKENRLDHFRCFTRDITQRKRVEGDLRRARDELEARVRQRTVELTDAIIALNQEIAERKRIESLIRESEDQLATAQEIAHIGSWVWDIAPNTVSWSDELYRIYGLAPQESNVTYESFLSRVIPEDREKVNTIISRALRDHIPLFFEHRILRPDGSVRTLLARGEVILDAAGEPVRMVGTGQDISEQKQAEEELRRYGAHLRILHEIDKSILVARSVAEIAQAVVQHLRQFIPYFRATVLVFDWKVQEARVLAVDTAHETQKKAGERIPLSIYGLSEELLHGKIHIVEDVLEDPHPSLRVRELQTEGLRSYVSIPLMAQGQLIGSLNLGSDRPGAFASDDLDIAGELAGQLAVALQNARLFEEVTESRKRLQILSRQLVEAQENEQQHIARELHDEAGQALTSL
ncbi:MAG: PAS domain S-box protein, partial [Chloroflexi bacterium]|nr:PAS domain S-box protein [Chloroflexota bacterium]